jgi:hypothetical protein
MQGMTCCLEKSEPSDRNERAKALSLRKALNTLLISSYFMPYWYSWVPLLFVRDRCKQFMSCFYGLYRDNINIDHVGSNSRMSGGWWIGKVLEWSFLASSGFCSERSPHETAQWRRVVKGHIRVLGNSWTRIHFSKLNPLSKRFLALHAR